VEKNRRRVATAAWFRVSSSLILLCLAGVLAMRCNAAVVIIDSGGIQAETTYLGVPCLTLRENTERAITVSLGTNVMVGHDPNRLRNELAKILAGKAKKGSILPFWDGRAAERIASIITGKPCPGRAFLRMLKIN
jgi:UDP-N-acetylglucosamine 2-epimerase